MMNENDNLKTPTKMQDEVLLRQLMNLKKYETPETARMTRNKQNIMRQVREANANKRKSLGDLLEMNMPWFFAEPKYGIAAVFVAFVGLQYMGISSRSSSPSTGIYMSNNSIVSLEKNVGSTTNKFSYPSLPDNYRLFDGQQKSTDIRFVERLEPQK